MKVLKQGDGTELVSKAEAMEARRNGAVYGYHPHAPLQVCGQECIPARGMVSVNNAPSHTSDGYHTFAELYEHRHMLTALALSMIAGIEGETTLVWKSRKHFNEEPAMYESMFIAGVELPTGSISYHMPLEFWPLVRCPEMQQAPEFDGYTSDDVLERIRQFLSAR